VGYGRIPEVGTRFTPGSARGYLAKLETGLEFWPTGLEFWIPPRSITRAHAEDRGLRVGTPAAHPLPPAHAHP